MSGLKFFEELNRNLDSIEADPVIGPIDRSSLDTDDLLCRKRVKHGIVGSVQHVRHSSRLSRHQLSKKVPGAGSVCLATGPGSRDVKLARNFGDLYTSDNCNRDQVPLLQPSWGHATGTTATASFRMIHHSRNRQDIKKALTEIVGADDTRYKQSGSRDTP